MIELDLASQTPPMLQMFGGQGMEEVGINLQNMLSQVMPGRTRRRRVKVRGGAGGSSRRRRPRSWWTWTRR